MEAFQQPICSATSTVAPPVLDTMHDHAHAHVVLNNEHNESQTRQPPNYAILYLVVAGVVFLAFPVFVLQKDLRNRYRERNKKRAVIMRIKSKQAESASVAKEPSASSSTLPEQKPAPKVIVVDHKDQLEVASSMEEDLSLRKQKSVERRKVGKGRPGNPRSSSGRSTSRGKPPSSTTHNSASSINSLISREALDTPIRIEVTTEAQEADLQLPTPALSVAPELHRVSSMESLPRSDIDDPRTTPEAPVQNGSPVTDNDTPTASEDQSFSPSSPMSKPVIISSLSTPPASPSLSEYPSRAPRKSSSATSATAPSTTAPLTPASIPASIPLLGPAVEDDEATWDRADSSAGDAAWDWDGQANNYSPSKTRKVPEPATPPPCLPSLPSLPSLVFPTLNDEPVPGASPASQITALKAALEASRENERNLRCEVQHYSKECYTMKWRWSTAINEWQQREAQLQAQINHLMMQVQALSMQAPQYPAPPYALYPHPGSPFAQPYPGYPHAHQLSPLHSSPAPPSNDLSDVSEILAEAILKRPESLRSSVSRGRRNYGSPRSSSGTRPLGLATTASMSSSSSSVSSHKGSPSVAAGEIQDIEFPTLLEKPTVSPVAQMQTLEPLNEGEVASASS